MFEDFYPYNRGSYRFVQYFEVLILHAESWHGEFTNFLFTLDWFTDFSLNFIFDGLGISTILLLLCHDHLIFKILFHILCHIQL